MIVVINIMLFLSQAVPIHSNTFHNRYVRTSYHNVWSTTVMISMLYTLYTSLRLSLPSDWCGLRDDKLSEVSGIPGCVFVHANGFIGGNHTYQGALTMARKTLQMRTNTEN